MDKKSDHTNYFWFLNTLVKIQVPYLEGQGGLSLLEHHAPLHDSPPLHVHHTEDEVFVILEGDFRFNINNQERLHTKGDVLRIPKDVPHTYLVESKSGGHWMTITVRGDFEKLVREISRPAERNELPEPSGPPTPEAMKHLETVAAKYGIDIVGPPLH